MLLPARTIHAFPRTLAKAPDSSPLTCVWPKPSASDRNWKPLRIMASKRVAGNKDSRVEIAVPALEEPALPEVTGPVALLPVARPMALEGQAADRGEAPVARAGRLASARTRNTA